MRCHDLTITNLIIVCCNVIKNIKKTYDINANAFFDVSIEISIDVKICIDKIDYKIICKDVIDAIDVFLKLKLM